MKEPEAGYWRKRRVLVTGAGGFIGSHLCESLVALGADVTALLRYSSSSSIGNLGFLPPEKLSRISLRFGDVTDSEYVVNLVESQGTVFHLAALIGIPYSYQAAGSYLRTNVEGTLNVLQACKRHRIERVVHTSTSECYGTALRVPMDEGHPLVAQSPYAASKIAADKVAQSMHLSFGLPVTTVRPFNTFGPRQSLRAVIPTVIAQALQRPFVRIGSVDVVRDFNFVSDVVRGFLLAAENPAAIGKTLNFGTGRGVSVGDLCGIVGKVVGKPLEIRLDRERTRPEASEVAKLVCDAGLARALLGWQPMVELEAGLGQTAEFIRSRIENYDPDRYGI